VTLRRVAGNFASMATLRIGLAAMTFGLFLFLSHRLSTAELGGFSLLMNSFFMVQTLPLLGMTLPLIRRVAARPESAPREIANSFFFALPVAAVIGVLLAAAGRWYSAENLGVPFALLGLSMLPTAWTVIAECVLAGHEQMRGIAFVNLMEALLRLVGTWAAISRGCGLDSVFLLFLGLRIAAAVTYSFNPLVSAPRRRLLEKAMLAGYWREVPTYFAIALVTALCARLDILVVSRLLSLRDVGLYAAASRLSDAALMVPTTAAVVIFPAQARLFAADEAGFVSLLGRAVRWCLIAGFAAALLVVAVAPSVVRVVYAANLAPAAALLRILILGAALMVTDQLLSTTMMASQSQHADLRSMSLGLAALVTLLFLCTHFFGLPGAAMAAPAALLLRVGYRLFWAQRRFALGLVDPAGRIVIAAAVAVGAFYAALAHGAAAALPASLAAYVTVLGLTRAVGAADWQSLRLMLAARTVRA
jgi:O-antigen/teichoic acid export membrane protein